MNWRGKHESQTKLGVKLEGAKEDEQSWGGGSEIRRWGGTMDAGSLAFSPACSRVTLRPQACVVCPPPSAAVQQGERWSSPLRDQGLHKRRLTAEPGKMKRNSLARQQWGSLKFWCLLDLGCSGRRKEGAVEHALQITGLNGRGAANIYRVPSICGMHQEPLVYSLGTPKSQVLLLSFLQLRAWSQQSLGVGRSHRYEVGWPEFTIRAHTLSRHLSKKQSPEEHRAQDENPERGLRIR